MYILFEGVDTSGKTTQIELLKRNFSQIVTTKEPAGTEFGEWAREILLGGKLQSKRAETLLFLSDRAEHYHQIVKPNRASKTVISDRGFISGIAYALASGEFEFEELLQLNLFALESDLPDFVIFFELDKATLCKRLGTKSKDAIEARGIDYILRVQEEIKSTIQRLALEYKIIDATESIDSISKEIYQIFSEKGVK
jgi:dTMP kinase